MPGPLTPSNKVARLGTCIAASLCMGLGFVGAARAEGPLRDPSSAMHPEGLPGSEPVSPIAQGHYASFLTFTFDRLPLRLERDEQRSIALIRERWVADAAFVIGWHRRASVSLHLPILLYQEGDSGFELAGYGVGDLVLQHKFSLLPSGEVGGFGLSLLNTVSAPVATDHSYLGDSAPTAGLSLLGELRMMLLVLRSQAGVLIRERTTLFGAPLGPELPFALSLQIKPQLFGWDPQGRWIFNLHVRGGLQTAGGLASEPFSRASWGATARIKSGDLALIFGSELPLNSGAGLAAVRGLFGVQFAPSSFDRDSDGIDDDDDFCPDEPEDYDQDVDEDGCPEFDGSPPFGEPL